MLYNQREYVDVDIIKSNIADIDQHRQFEMCNYYLCSSAVSSRNATLLWRDEKERPSPSGFQLFVACHFPFLSSDFLSIFYCLLMQGSKKTSKTKRQRQPTPAAFIKAFLIHF